MLTRNRSRSLTVVRFAILTVAIGLLPVGCDRSLSPEVVAWRKEFVAAREPDGAITLTEAKAKLSEESDVTIVGRVGSGKLDPFDKSKAVFILAEAPSADHAHESGHDEKECVFCRRKLEEAPLAHVEFRDASGSPIAMSAKDLLGISEGRIVVVQGRGKYDSELDTVTMTARSLYVRVAK